MDSQLLTELLKGKHFNMRERIERGAWPHPPLHFNDLVNHLVSIIENQESFPVPWVERKDGSPVSDRTVIVRESTKKFVVYFERSGPFMNLAEKGEKVFCCAKDAVDFYLRAELNLPGDLDGWKVIK